MIIFKFYSLKQIQYMLYKIRRNVLMLAVRDDELCGRQ